MEASKVFGYCKLFLKCVLIQHSRESLGRHQMGTVDKQGVVTMQELLVSSLATADALAKLLIEKGLITQAEFTK